MNSTDFRNQKQVVSLMHPTFEHDLSVWVISIWTRGIHLTDSLIQEKARRLFLVQRMNKGDSQGYSTNYSNTWLVGFKKRNWFKGYKSQGEASDADVEAATRGLPILRKFINEYGEENFWHADESAFYYSRPRRTTIGPGPLPCRAGHKNRVSVLFSCNAAGTERMKPFIIGRAVRPRCFGKSSAGELGFDYIANQRAWMNQDVFFQWILRSNYEIAKTPGRQVVLLLDNASCHGTHLQLPILSNVTVYFLPARTTSILQPLDAGVIAAVKKRYIERITRVGLDRLSNNETNDTYQVDLKFGIEWLYKIWAQMSADVIRNCWVKTKILE